MIQIKLSQYSLLILVTILASEIVKNVMKINLVSNKDIRNKNIYLLDF